MLADTLKKMGEKTTHSSHWNREAAQRSYGWPIPRSVQGQGGQSLEQLLKGVPANGRGVKLDDP